MNEVSLQRLSCSMILSNKNFALSDYQKKTHSKSSGMNYLTWKESAAMLLKKICQEETAKDSEKHEPLACAS
jgi:hypothetical protein